MKAMQQGPVKDSFDKTNYFNLCNSGKILPKSPFTKEELYRPMWEIPSSGQGGFKVWRPRKSCSFYI
jgi:hypothetical protein